MKFVKTLGLVSALAAVNATAATTEILLQYDTAGSVSSLAPFYESSAIVGDNLEMGSGLTANTYSTFNSYGWDVASTSFEDAVAANDYWSFGFDATQGVQLTHFDVRLDRSGTGPDDFEIRASVNGGAATTVLGHDYGDSGSAVEFIGIDLSAFTLAAGDSIEFILAAFNSESENGTFDLETITYPGDDGLVIYGEVAPVPLPAAAWLFLGGLVGLRQVARRNNRVA